MGAAVASPSAATATTTKAIAGVNDKTHGRSATFSHAKVANTSVEVLVSGTLSDYELSLRSNPPLPQQEIVSLITTGTRSQTGTNIGAEGIALGGLNIASERILDELELAFVNKLRESGVEWGFRSSEVESEFQSSQYLLGGSGLSNVYAPELFLEAPWKALFPRTRTRELKKFKFSVSRTTDTLE